MILMQTNHTAKAGRIGTIDPSADQIRDEMTRMLDELPENAIVKSHKEKKHHHENQNHQNQASGQQQAPLNSTSTNKLDKSLGGQPKQLQARTQKIDLKFNSQQRMEGLMLRVQKQTSQNSYHQSEMTAAGASGKLKKSSNKLPPKTLVVNRLAVTKKDLSEQ